MRRYLSLWWSFFQNSLTRDMEYKANFLGGLFIDVIFYGIQFFFFSVIYSYVEALGVFSREDVIIFLIVTFLVDTFYMFFFAGNVFNLNRWMVRGDLDFFLLIIKHRNDHWEKELKHSWKLSIMQNNFSQAQALKITTRNRHLVNDHIQKTELYEYTTIIHNYWVYIYINCTLFFIEDLKIED